MLADLKRLAEQAGEMRYEKRVENPNHDSLALKFQQLDLLLDTVANSPYFEEIQAAAFDAKILANLIRAQVLK